MKIAPYLVIAFMAVGWLLLYTGLKDPQAPPGMPQLVAVATGKATPKKAA